jgi:hypothetical protein
LTASSGRSRDSPARLAAEGRSTSRWTTVAPLAAVSDEQLAAGRAEDGAAAQGEDAVVVGERPGDGGLLQRTEVLLAGGDEQVGDGAAGERLDVGVGVAEGHAQRGRDRRPDGGLARRRRTDQHQQRGPAHRNGRASR